MDEPHDPHDRDADPPPVAWGAIPAPPTEPPGAWRPAPGASAATGGWDPAVARPPAGQRRRPTAIILGAVGLVASLAAVVAIKVLPFLAVGVVATALSGAFGGPWDRLPSDVRSGYEQRLKAAVADRFDGLSDAQVATEVQRLVASGLLRLDDARITRHLELQIVALGRSEERICADFGRRSFAGLPVADETSTAMISSLTTEGLVEWIGISVEAIEAESRGSPPPAAVVDAEASRLFELIFAGMGDADIRTIGTITQGGSTTDAEACAAARALYAQTQLLDPASEAAIARLDIQP